MASIAREGLVLHTIAYEDAERVRPIMYRGSFSEMVVPYGETAPTHVWKNAFDIGEYGIGALANSLELGCDCLGEIRYFDAVLSDAAGEPMVLKNAVCLHEEDASLLWEHVDWRTGETEVRRNRRLVLSFVATVGNYEYGYYWYFQHPAGRHDRGAGQADRDRVDRGRRSRGAGALRDDGRARAHRPVSPALLQRADGHDGRR